MTNGLWEPAQLRDFRAELQSNPALASEAEQLLKVKASETWPDPKPLGGELPPVAPFETALLPEALRAGVADISDRMQTPPDFAAAAGVLTFLVAPSHVRLGWR
jgi:hypothetical protein